MTTITVDHDLSVGARIRCARMNRAMTARDVARAAGVASLNRIEQDRMRPRPGDVLALSHVLATPRFLNRGDRSTDHLSRA